ncbi:iron-sulfur cluster repair di-iron protein [Acidobacteria bacterium ACD]|nr:MAG: iron-sulfur cluster repair di-iron protein [Acidobacteriota bacterium]MDL1948451.1 iron-sulfur cluster repair di-iron protein [Acidobacteria bacterium ACD]
MQLTPASTVGEVAATHPSTIRVFQAHGIDFCCGGGRSLSDVCAAYGVPAAALIEELSAAASAGAGTVPALADAPVGEVVRHVLSRYHAWLWRELPRLGGMADKVLRVHGERDAEAVPAMHRLFTALSAELEPHLVEEEDVVFPALLALEARALSGRPAGLATPLQRVGTGVAALERQHEAVGALLRELRAACRDFVPPEVACNTYRGLLHGLSELEREVHEHVHLENNVLFPAVARLAQA